MDDFDKAYRELVSMVALYTVLYYSPCLLKRDCSDGVTALSWQEQAREIKTARLMGHAVCWSMD